MRVNPIEPANKGFEAGVRPNKLTNLAYSSMLSLSLLSAVSSDVFTKSEPKNDKTEFVQAKPDNTQKAGWWAENGGTLFFIGALLYVICGFSDVLKKSIENLSKI